MGSHRSPCRLTDLC